MSRPVVRAAVFDLDGLMVNTEVIFHEVGHEVLRRRGRQMTMDLLLRMMGRRAPEALAVMKEEHGLEDTISDLIVETRGVFEEFAAERLQTMPGLLELLTELDRCQLPLAVATSSGRVYLEQMLARFDLQKRFAVTLAAEDVKHGKPHPEIYLEAARRLGAAPAQTLVFEDSLAGTQAAVAAGTIAISVPAEYALHLDYSIATHIVDRLDHPTVLNLLRAVHIES